MSWPPESADASAARQRLLDFYKNTLASSGTTSKGVDCSAFGQQERFRQLLRIADGFQRTSLLDYGCGYGELARYLANMNAEFEQYQGFDLSPEMIGAAGSLFADHENIEFTNDRSNVRTADFTVASGIFNKNFIGSDDPWRSHIERTLDDIASLSRIGFSFNMLTMYSDADKMRSDLYYGDPHHFFTYCRRFSKHVALLHDYDLYDFTILVRKTLPAR